jgi:hypothetical protein
LTLSATGNVSVKPKVFDGFRAWHGCDEEFDGGGYSAAHWVGEIGPGTLG